MDLTVPAIGRNPDGMARLAAATGRPHRDGRRLVSAANTTPRRSATKSVERAGRRADPRVPRRSGGRRASGRASSASWGQVGGAIRAGEERAFRAAARAQREVGFSISTHTTHYGELAFDQIALLREEGVPVERIVVGHVGERRGAADVLAIAETGVFVQIDHVGRRWRRA